jgi:hypothetical protein
LTVEESELRYRFVALGNADLEKMGKIRGMGAEFSSLLLDLLPEGPGKERVLFQLWEVVLAANGEVGLGASRKRGM